MYSIYIYEFFRDYYEEEGAKAKEKIFQEFWQVVEKKDTDMFEQYQKSIFDLLFEHDYVKTANFTEETFPLALKWCLRKIMDKYVVPEIYYQDIQYFNGSSSCREDGMNDEDIIFFYIHRNLVYQLKNWSKTYSTGKYNICRNCGKLILKSAKGRPSLYCKNCKENMNLERYKKYNKKRLVK